jgi:pyridoxal biosynthesis lyase PdxS
LSDHHPAVIRNITAFAVEDIDESAILTLRDNGHEVVNLTFKRLFACGCRNRAVHL